MLSQQAMKSGACVKHSNIKFEQYHTPEIKSQGRFIVDDPLEMRVLDVLGSLALLVVFGPLMVLIALTIIITDPGPAIFKQKRVGRNGKLFNCYKFRTMAIDAEARLEQVLAADPQAQAEWERDQKLRNDPRIVGFGQFLRKSSLDELPQLWNVLKGDMSMVGPRPIVPDEATRYGKYLAFYCAVKPGITGLWQISGRNDVSYRRRVAFDVVYARKSKVADNIKILAMTLPSVITSKGSY